MPSGFLAAPAIGIKVSLIFTRGHHWRSATRSCSLQELTAGLVDAAVANGQPTA